MMHAFVIGVVHFGSYKSPLKVYRLRWAYDSEDESLSVILYGEDNHIPLDIVQLTNVIPKEFVLKVTKEKRKIKKVRHSHIIEYRLHERNNVLMELAQDIHDSDKKTWNKEELIKYFQAMEM